MLTGSRVLVHAGELDRAPSTGAGLTLAAGTCLPGVCGVGLVSRVGERERERGRSGGWGGARLSHAAEGT